jgi:uncharacterized protein YgbK (DUF1537 family)
LDDAQTAAAKVADATRLLLELGCTRFYKKTCSAFRGNVGAECDALLEATGLPCMIVSGVYPGNGRSTRNGRHFVHGVPLEDSQFRDDPVHPMRTSLLQEIFAQQSHRKAVVIPLSTVRGGAALLQQALEEAALAASFLIVDGETEEDLTTLAEAARSFKLIGGSAGVSAYWIQNFIETIHRSGAPLPRVSGNGGSLVVSGSLTPQTLEQSRRLRDTGIATSELETLRLTDPDYLKRWSAETVRRGTEALQAGKAFFLYATQEPARVNATQAAARMRHESEAQLGKRVSALLAEGAHRILLSGAASGLVIAGGDTAGSVCGRLGISGNRIVEQLDTGVPLGITTSHDPIFIVLKSGGFGKPGFLVEAVARIAEKCQPHPLR